MAENQIIPSDSQFQDLTGKTFRKLTVLGWAGRKKSKLYWNVRCECGRETMVLGPNLRSGVTGSCGICYRGDGRTSLPEYDVWNGMIDRCCRPKCSGYKHYGGRGITICKRWRDSFWAFFHDMGPRPPSGYSIDRINNDGNYEPGNCRWATRTEQARNTRVNRIITHDGKTMCLAEWAEYAVVSDHVIGARLKLGWDFQEALETPLHGKSHCWNPQEPKPLSEMPVWQRFPRWRHLKPETS